MNYYTAHHFRKTAKAFRETYSGARITLRWVSADTGTYDQERDEYGNSTPTYFETSGVPALIYEISKMMIEVANWGSAEVGDLIVAIDPSWNLEDMRDVRVVYNDQEYFAVPNSRIPVSRLAGVVGDKPLSIVLHCRFGGQKPGTL